MGVECCKRVQSRPGVNTLPIPPFKGTDIWGGRTGDTGRTNRQDGTKGRYMTKVDLKDAYFMVPVHQKHQHLTRFMWKGRAYQFTCLPFGLSSAPWAFTKITRPIITVLRCMGLRTIMYIGDILILAESETLAREHTAALIFLLENLGLVVNHPKSQAIPSQVLEFLGFSIDSRSMEIKLPGDKIKKRQGDYCHR